METWIKTIEQQYKMSFNEAQKEVMAHAYGPALVLACPGSGKTTTLIMRIRTLIERGVESNRILAITFSKQAALELQSRYVSFFGKENVPPFSTIHRLAFQIARVGMRRKGIRFTFIEGQKNDWSKQQILHEVYEHVTGQYGPDDRLQTLATFISEMKNKMIERTKWPQYEPFRDAGKMGQLYERWKRRDRGHIYIDFDDMLTIAEWALRTDPALRMEYASQYDHILTDESQDTSLVQHKLIEWLASIHRNLFVVADDDQSIYTWRGASPEYLLQFEQRYPESAVYYLTTNYRSGSEIIEAANQLIKRNQNRYEKEMKPATDEKSSIHLQTFSDSLTQLQYVADELKEEHDLGETAVLFRNNASSTLYANELHRRGIPFYMKEGDYLFFSHWLVRDIVSFMKLVQQRDDIAAFRQICFKLELYLSRKMLTALEQYEGDETNIFDRFIAANPSLRTQQKESLQTIKETYETLEQETPSTIIEYIRNEFQYEKAITKRAEKFGHRIDYLLEMLQTLSSIASSTPTIDAFFETLDNLKQVMQESKEPRRDDVVTLSTIHSAKGLEWERVFMIDLQQGILPTEEDEASIEWLEEARRLFYVGMTRAKRRLELLSVEEINGKKSSPSRFVDEVRYDQLSEEERQKMIRATLTTKKKRKYTKTEEPISSSTHSFYVGMDVLHRVFGRGKVTNLFDTTIYVRFSDRERKFDIPTVVHYEMLHSMKENE